MMNIPYVREAGAALLIALLVFGGWKLHRSGYTAGFNAANIRAEKIIGEYAQAEAAAQAKARASEQAAATATAAIAAAYEQGKTDAQANEARVIAGLRDGSIKLRRAWAGCETDGLSASASRTAELNAAAAERIASAGRIIGNAARADSQIKGLQAVVRADRQ